VQNTADWENVEKLTICCLGLRCRRKEELSGKVINLRVKDGLTTVFP
jgi:hypothetical protein